MDYSHLDMSKMRLGQRQQLRRLSEMRSETVMHKKTIDELASEVGLCRMNGETDQELCDRGLRKAIADFSNTFQLTVNKMGAVLQKDNPQVTKNTWFEDYWQDGKRDAEIRTMYLPEKPQLVSPQPIAEWGWFRVIFLGLCIGIIAAFVVGIFTDTLWRYPLSVLLILLMLSGESS